jgi:hypothetical protein
MIFIILLDLAIRILSQNLNANDYSEYALASQIKDFFETSHLKPDETFIINNGTKNYIDIYTGKIFNESSREYYYKRKILLDIIHGLDLSGKCESEILNLTRFYYMNKDFQPNYLYEVKDGNHLIVKCPICEVNRNEKIWLKMNFSGSFENSYEFIKSTNNSNLNRIMIVKNYSLLIKYFQQSDSGIYICLDKKILNKLINNSDRNTLVKNLYNISRKEVIYFKNTTDLKIHKWQYFSEIMFKINIHLFYSFKAFSNQKRYTIETGLSISNISRFKHLKINAKKESYYENKSNLYFYSLWSNWSRCQMCQRKKKSKYMYRKAECRVIYKAIGSKGLTNLNKTFFPFGLPCSFINAYYDLIPLETFNLIPNNLVEIKKCECTEVSNE